MTKQEELTLFLEKANELVSGQYILADIKMAQLLRVIATSETLLALFKNCLNDFDMAEAKKKYLVKNPYHSGEKGQFVLPNSSKELLAFVFTLLVEIDGKTRDFSEFISKYFYENGSFTAGYDSFVNTMIKPFVSSVKVLMERVIEGKLQDPVKAIKEQEKREEAEKIERQARAKKNKELSQKSYAESIVKIKEILLADKQKVKESKLKECVKREALIVIDTLGSVIEENDKDAIEYAYIAYKYFVKSHPFFFFMRNYSMKKLIKDLKNGL